MGAAEAAEPNLSGSLQRLDLVNPSAEGEVVQLQNPDLHLWAVEVEAGRPHFVREVVEDSTGASSRQTQVGPNASSIGQLVKMATRLPEASLAAVEEVAVQECFDL